MAVTATDGNYRRPGPAGVRQRGRHPPITFTSGDGATPPDPDAAFTSFAAAVARTWLQGPRDRVRAMGPVPSSRFN